MKPSRNAVIAIVAFVGAAVLAVGVAVASVSLIERQTRAEIESRLTAEGLTWVEVGIDGLLVTLRGQGPSEAARFRALSLAGAVVDGTRILDEIDVAPGMEIEPPRFQMELLRNRDDISIIGLVPTVYDPETVVTRLSALGDSVTVTEMLETADHPLPDGWSRAVSFALDSLRVMPVSKVSISANRVEIAALADSAQHRREMETRLRQGRPSGLTLVLDITAPRPVITPFTLRFTIEDARPRFDACSAGSEAARDEIIAAARAVGMESAINCTLGMGSPTPRWAEAAAQSVTALGTLGAGSITLSDTDISLVVPHDVSQSAFDRVVGELEGALPDVFSLESVRLDAPEDEPESADEPVEFVAALTSDGMVQLRGRLTDERMRDAVHAFARARFGSQAVQMAARLDPALPEGWPLKALSALEALAELDNGTVTVRPDRIELRGVSGNEDSSDMVSRILSEKLGQGADFRVNVTYDERLDPASQIPTPERCEGWIREILAERQITFDPGAARIDSGTGATLDQIAEVMRECGALEMEIGGHTDSQGSAEGNMRLSQRRAEAVLDALLARQVLVSGLVAQGYGEERPIADNATAEGREANRRIEFRLLSTIAAEPVIPTERDPELEAQLEIRVTEGAGEAPRPAPRPARD
ncbi:OmpA family protein [Rhodobacteraceae bacterium 2376]|uniref:OmpA family protein n=1 Tax=Rhabdonatronobacter sediminivivens TaxID=2743469 RepID=A0A7Z0HY53_9RHOB|nr:OmpA family protein [Rhabdonatronobacter sediminivivens]NYS24433.1 OmpA family protein [Rhabdonatronobacter sediminivivens]